MFQVYEHLLTDIFWVTAMVAMGIFCTILARARLRPSAARWFGALVFMACINIVGVLLTDLIDKDHLLGLRAISLGRAFLPFCMLGFSLAFPYRRFPMESRLGLCLLVVPSLVTLVVTDPTFAPGDVSYQLKYHIPWMGAYFAWAYVNLILSYRRTRLRITRRQHVLLSLATVPATGMHYITSILLPAFGLNEVWRYNWIPILIAFVIVSGAFVRSGMIIRRTVLMRSMLHRSIDTARLSSQIVTHAVKNALQTMRSLAETASMPTCTDREERIARIVALCDDLSTRMNRLNLLARARVRLVRELLPVAEPLESAIERAERRLGSHELQRDYMQPIPRVVADRVHLEEVFLNLLNNAVEAMPGSGRLRLEIRVENDWVLVAFHDEGVGIPPAQIAWIFEPFQTTKHSGANWGIGLSYCHLVVERLGGDLCVESRPGQGSSFTVLLPLPSSSSVEDCLAAMETEVSI